MQLTAADLFLAERADSADLILAEWTDAADLPLAGALIQLTFPLAERTDAVDPIAEGTDTADRQEKRTALYVTFSWKGRQSEEDR